MIFIFFIIFSFFILYTYNALVNRLCTKNEVPEEKQKLIYNYVNVSTVLLLLCTYYDFTHVS
ncbi:hypothetical protein JOD43_003606 [Pullulanibacillus pueri]|uniref:Uncharacterized protein n=1 Tax=Pullulanibacillus pueri TaxID=1437324 RepID=A0A8J3A1W3_9BACL|nr:hypothetical protein [Pullulanibacillus pueri]MBM7683426.1 hypothetical protein [Pullulanibacillus pueri]GGH88091.1 hypothetical protein GCM10007096_39620 [Pullulanibacillus pueri]